MVRTRFAPSPTGFLHVGGVRTALFAWLVARQAGGEFILRIEDTDRARHVKDSQEHIVESLRWLGLDWDEGPIRQSERLDIYRSWAEKLIASGRAYADSRSPLELEKIRKEFAAAKEPVLFRERRPSDLAKWRPGTPLRFKSQPKSYKWHDEVLGDLTAGPEAIDDFILLKSDGFPTYNFAHIVDDSEMKISHVVRSQEFLPSVPRFLNLYEALKINQPKLATLPYVLGPDGKKKLSKRDGAKDLLEYREEGYLPEALVSFLATLGWHDGTDQEIFTIKELVKKFSLSRVQHGGAHFDDRRLTWVNGYFIRAKPLDELYNLSKDFWPKSANSADADYKKAVLSLVQERLKCLGELPELTSFFFEDLPIDTSLLTRTGQLSKLTSEERLKLLKNTIDQLKKSDFTVEDLTKKLNDLLVITGQKPGILFSLIRIATTWAPASPGLAETLSVLGRDTSLSRLKHAVSVLAM